MTPATMQADGSASDERELVSDPSADCGREGVDHSARMADEREVTA